MRGGYGPPGPARGRVFAGSGEIQKRRSSFICAGLVVVVPVSGGQSGVAAGKHEEVDGDRGKHLLSEEVDGNVGGLRDRGHPPSGTSSWKSSSSHLLHSHASFHVTVRNASLAHL